MTAAQYISIGARNSLLSRAQVEEVLAELRVVHPEVDFQPVWVETTGDKDLLTSLRTLEKTDFFTREIDALQLAGGCRLSIHSAKDLPDPLPKGLVLAALTKGVDPSDTLVIHRGATLETLPLKATIGTSSCRRENNVRKVLPDCICVDIRGTIPARLQLLDERVVDGVVMAEAALIRLRLTHRTRIPLPGEAAPLQGQLAVLACEGDQEMFHLFQAIDVRCR
jgi:hydroxymethylbilane synthase